MSQPPKSTMRAPCARCVALRTVCFVMSGGAGRWGRGLSRAADARDAGRALAWRRAMETTGSGAALVPLALRGVSAYGAVLLDPDGTIVGWNAGAEDLLGYAAGEVFG